MNELRATTTANLWCTAGRWRGVGAALGILALTRAGQLVLLTWLDAASMQPLGLRDRLLSWDAGWFLKIATVGYPHGYSYDQAHQLQGNELAFFPLYPLLIRAVSALGPDPGTAAIVVSWLASAAAAVALHLLGTTLYGKRVGWALVGICFGAPASVVFSMAYSEGLFLALVAGMFVAAHRRVWWAAGLLGLGASLTRPTGVAAVLALSLAAVLAVRRARAQRKRDAEPANQTADGADRGRSQRVWAPIIAAVVALAGAPAYLGWVGLRVGDPSAWFRIQAAGWGTAFDFGASILDFLGRSLSGAQAWVPLSVAWILLAALVAAGVAVARRPWPPLAAYGVIAMVLVYGQAGFYHSKPRLLLPVLLTLLPAAVAAGRARPLAAVLSIGAWAVFGLWYGAYLLTVWPYTL